MNTVTSNRNCRHGLSDVSAQSTCRPSHNDIATHQTWNPSRCEKKVGIMSYSKTSIFERINEHTPVSCSYTVTIRRPFLDRFTLQILFAMIYQEAINYIRACTLLIGLTLPFEAFGLGSRIYSVCLADTATLLTNISACAGVRNSELMMHCETRIVVVTFSALTHSLPFKPIAISYCTAAPRAERTAVVGLPKSFLANAVEHSTRHPFCRWPKPTACKTGKNGGCIHASKTPFPKKGTGHDKYDKHMPTHSWAWAAGCVLPKQ